MFPHPESLRGSPLVLCGCSECPPPVPSGYRPFQSAPPIPSPFSLLCFAPNLLSCLPCFAFTFLHSEKKTRNKPGFQVPQCGVRLQPAGLRACRVGRALGGPEPGRRGCRAPHRPRRPPGGSGAFPRVLGEGPGQGLRCPGHGNGGAPGSWRCNMTAGSLRTADTLRSQPRRPPVWNLQSRPPSGAGERPSSPLPALVAARGVLGSGTHPWGRHYVVTSPSICIHSPSHKDTCHWM